MSAEPLPARLDELRRAFDESFAEPRGSSADALEALLAVRVGGDAYAVRLPDVVGLFNRRRIVALPSREPAFLGIVGVRGSVFPVYSLSVLFDRPPGPTPPWMVLAGASERVALAFEEYQGHLAVPRTTLVPAQGAGAATGFFTEMVRLEAGGRPILNVAAVLEAIRGRAVSPPKER